MNILGITLGHDSSVALIIDGVVHGIMEAERYFRQKRYKLHCLTLEPGQHVPDINGTPSGNSDIFQLFWFEPTEDLWTLHLVAHCIAPEGCGGGDV